MNAKAKIFNEFINEKGFNVFDIKDDGEVVAFLHKEEQIQSLIVINNSMRTEIFYELAHCPNMNKKEEIVMYLNELNSDKVLKYSLDDDGRIIAAVTYWANENELDASVLLNIYIGLLKSLLEDKIIEKLMRIIWR